MSRRLAKITGISFIAFALTLAFSLGSPMKIMAADTFKIGHLETLSGPFAFQGIGFSKAVQFAVEEQNKKGGLLGKKIEYIPADSQLKPDVGIREVKKLILEDKVDMIVGTLGSHVNAAITPVCESYKKIFIDFSSAADESQGSGFSRYKFRLYNNAYQWTASLAKYMATKPYRRYYIICQDYKFGHSMGNDFKAQLKKYLPDAQIVGEIYHPIGTKDFGPYITKVIQAKADAIFSSNWGPDQLLLIKHARSMGLKQPFPFVMITLDPYVTRELKDDAVGMYMTWVSMLSVNTPEMKSLITRWHERYKNDDFGYWWPYGSVGQSSFSIELLFAAIEKAGSFDTEKIIEILEGFRYKTPVGWWTIRKCDHQVILPMFGNMIVAGDNPWFNGKIDPKIKFPWLGPNPQMIPAEEIALPATKEYNKRCP